MSGIRELVDKWREAYYVKAGIDSGLFDYLADHGQTMSTIQSHYQQQNMHRLVNALLALDYLTDTPNGIMTNPVHNLHDKDASERVYAEFYLSDWSAKSFAAIAPAIAAGKDAFSLTHEQKLFSYLDQHSDAAHTFNRAMRHDADARGEALANLIAWSRFRSVADIGGGLGQIIDPILQQHAHLQGYVFDRDQVVESAASLDLSDRLVFIAGDFFAAIPLKADAYLLYHILHDWNDQDARRILANLRALFATADQRLFIIERLYDPENTATVHMDMTMLTLTTDGRERTLDQFVSLMADFFTVLQVTPVSGQDVCIECQWRQE